MTESPVMELPEGIPMDNWGPEVKRYAIEKIKREVPTNWKPFYCPVPMCDGTPHVGRNDNWDFPHARWKQHPPKGDWFIWLIRSGRAWGKSLCASRLFSNLADKPTRFALIGKTMADVRMTMIEGRSGLLATAKPGNVPFYEPTKRKITWPSGAVAHCFSGEEPDALRGPQFEYAWLDEPAHIPLIEDVWSNLTLGMRDGDNQKIVITSTPLPSKWMKELNSREDVTVTVGSTWENAANLSARYKKSVLEPLAGTTKGRQEIEGEILFELEGALWSRKIIRHVLPDEKPPQEWEFERIIVSIDPAGSARQKSDETGIVVLGKINDIIYVLADASGKYTPHGWATRAIQLYDYWNADAIVAEVNFGRDMVAATINSTGATVRIIPVESRRGKVLRAEPVVALYEANFVYHFPGLTGLEDQMTEWIVGKGSPDRVDALVHGVTELTSSGAPASVGVPWYVRKMQEELEAMYDTGKISYA